MNTETLTLLSKQVEFSDKLNREIGPEQGSKMLEFVELLSKWSEKMSLVSSPNPERIINEHILDCWAAFQFVPRETTYLDIGSGSGLPGIIFSILAPECRVILLEPRVKRIDFLKEARRVLALENIEPSHSRLEAWKWDDGAVSAVERAVGMEAELYRVLKAKITHVSFSAMVSLAWKNPLPNQPQSVGSYTLANGNSHQVVCFT